MNNSLAVAQRATCKIDATNLRYSYGTRPVIDGISFSMHGGEFICIVGPNGCGKSTLLKLLMGHQQPQTGTVELDGRNLHALAQAAVAQHIALVPQAGTVGFSYTVEQVVLMARWPWRPKGLIGGLGFETKSDLQIATDAINAMDITHLAQRPVTELSGGERQRVLVARALAQQTPAILLDEPTSAMDIKHQLQMLTLLRNNVRTQQKSVICVTHDLNLAAEWADRVILMDAGKIIVDAPPAKALHPDLLEKVYGVRVQTAPAIRFTL